MNPSKNLQLSFWLATLSFITFLMILIGGLTRLTDSGLSMVDWKPLMGIIPPMNDIQWNESFNQYKQYPEYQKINQGMNLSEYKNIVQSKCSTAPKHL